MLSELTKVLQLSQEQVCVLCSLLGNFLLPESELQDLYRKIASSSGCKETKVCLVYLIKANLKQIFMFRCQETLL